MQHGNPFARQNLCQQIRITHERGGRDPERRADEIGNPNFLERHVKGRGKTLKHPIGLAHAQDLVFAAEKVADATLADDDALGLPR